MHQSTFVLIICALLLITGCATQPVNAFGIPETQWNRMTLQQQNQVIENYYQQQVAMKNEQVLDNAAKITKPIFIPSK